MPFVLYFATRFPITPVRAGAVAMHIAVFGVISVAHAALDAWAMTFEMPHVTQFFSLTARITRSWYNTMPTVVSMYAAALIAAWGMMEARERQRRTLRAAQLESQLQSARLAALRAQLHPHFLYNTLNGIAALVSDVQPARAVAAIEELSELLHASLRDDGREEVTVAEEISLAKRYLSLQMMRFGDRLRYDVDIDANIADCLVPVLLLQPVVENAVVHGLDAGQESLHVRIRARDEGKGVALIVENDGPALRAETARPGGHGVGLAATRARLLTAFGDDGSLSLAPRDGGGAVVRIAFPKRTAPPAERAVAPLEEARA